MPPPLTWESGEGRPPLRRSAVPAAGPCALPLLVCGLAATLVAASAVEREHSLVSEVQRLPPKPFPDQQLTRADEFVWSDAASHYRVLRGGVLVGYLAARDGKSVPKTERLPAFQEGDAVQAWRYHVAFFTDVTVSTYDAGIAAARHDSRDLGCWNAGGYTPDICCPNGGWDECWSGPFDYASCCGGWATDKDKAFTEDVRWSFSEQSFVMTASNQAYSQFYPHPLLHAALIERAVIDDRPRVIAEIGVDEGTYAWHLLAELQRRGVKVERFYAIDPWQIDHDRGELSARTPEDMAGPFLTTARQLARFWPAPRFLQERGDKAALLVDDASVDFAFIDAIHTYEYVTLHLELWWPKVRPGGLIGGHDYAQEKPGRFPGPVAAAQGFAAKRGLTAYLHGLPGTSFVILKPRDAS